jgi:hypothetical protein
MRTLKSPSIPYLPLDNTDGSCYALRVGKVPILFLVNTDRKKGGKSDDTQHE